MSRVMSFLGGLLGGQPEGPQPSEAEETIQKLCDRVASSTLLQDRRDAVRALTSLSKTYRAEVGKQALEHLVHILQTEQFDSEILGYVLATLQNIICDDEGEEVPDENTRKQREDLAMRFIQDSKNVTVLLTLLEEFDFHVRRPGVKLLTALLERQCAQVQGIVLVSHLGVSRLMDLLQDSREVIRNDVLLLLRQLTKGNTAIQKIVAFQNAFEHLLDIIAEEGSSNGGIIVEDCLQLLLNLLKNNSSNQNFFKEGYYIQRMTPWFEVCEDDSGWSAQKVTILHLMLQLVRVMVSPVNYPGATARCQKSMYQCGLLQQLCTIIMATTGVPVDIRTQTINTVSEVICASQNNQDYFATVNVPVPSNAPRPAIVVLLTSMVTEREPFELRCASLYCFQCFLYKNQKGQGEIVATLLQPSTTTDANIPAGGLLCAGLLSADSLSNWCAAVALAHTLQGNLAQKEQLLRVQLSTSLGKPVCLLQQCTNSLSQGSKVQTRVGLLILLCTWMSNCPIAVKHFLQNQVNVPFLLGQISENLGENERLVEGLCALLLGICVCYNDNSLENYTKGKLKQLIEMRIGKENFVEKLGFVTKHELFSRATQKPQPVLLSPEQMLFDHEFTKLTRELEDVIIRAVLKSSEEEEEKEDRVKKTLAQYQELIGEQEAKIAELESRFAAQACETEKLKVEVRRLSEGRAGLEKLQMEVQESKKEKDNLLMLLNDRDQKIHGLKLRLKDVGETDKDEEMCDFTP